MYRVVMCGPIFTWKICNLTPLDEKFLPPAGQNLDTCVQNSNSILNMFETFKYFQILKTVLSNICFLSQKIVQLAAPLWSGAHLLQPNEMSQNFSNFERNFYFNVREEKQGLRTHVSWFCPAGLRQNYNMEFFKFHFSKTLRQYLFACLILNLNLLDYKTIY